MMRTSRGPNALRAMGQREMVVGGSLQKAPSMPRKTVRGFLLMPIWVYVQARPPLATLNGRDSLIPLLKIVKRIHAV